MATPYTDPSQPQLRTKIVKHIRPLPESLISVFGEKLRNVEWSELDAFISPTDMVGSFQNTTGGLVESTFPEKRIQIYPNDKPWFNERLRSLKRERQRLYLKGDKNNEYLECKRKFNETKDAEILKYKQKILMEVKEGNVLKI